MRPTKNLYGGSHGVLTFISFFIIMKTYSYICTECANKALKGNHIDDGRCFTVHMGNCPVCKEDDKSMAHVRDFGLNEKLQFINSQPLD